MANKEAEQSDIDKLQRRLDMLDSRLDNIDSALSAVVERVMNQAITITITCPKCGKDIEVAVIGRPKITA